MKVKGISLLEVLIALAIFSISLLGAGSLCLRSLQVTRHAFQQSMAIVQMESVANLIQIGYQKEENPELLLTEVAFWQQQISFFLPQATMTIQLLPPYAMIEMSWQKAEIDNASHYLKMTVGKDGQGFHP